MKRKNRIFSLIVTLTIVLVACNLPFAASALPTPTLPPALPVPPTATLAIVDPLTEVAATNTPEIIHLLFPSTSPSTGGIIYDVFSKDTAPEKRAPYGDSYDINRFERPFMQDMIYLSDLDIVTYNLSEDADW